MEGKENKSFLAKVKSQKGLTSAPARALKSSCVAGLLLN
jgi:hypothetical protein